MVLSRKRPAPNPNTNPNNSFTPPFAPNPTKVPKPSTSNHHQRRPQEDAILSPPPPPPAIDNFVSVLADAGCTLINPAGPPCLPSDLHKFRRRLHHRFSDDSALRSNFLNGLSCYINVSSNNLRRVLLPSNCESIMLVRSESLIRVLLLVEVIQLDVQSLLLEKLPEYFDLNNGSGIFGSSSVRFDDDIARLILQQFRWLDFLVDSPAFTDKLFQVLSICPLHLKKEIIGSLPEIIGDQNNKTVVDSLQQMLQEDSSIIVPVLDTFSNLILDDLLKDEVIMVALSCIRTVEVEDMPYLLRFLLLSATPKNARKIIAKIREQVKFLGLSSIQRKPYHKNKGKLVDYIETSILDALKSSLRFKSALCQEILKELKSVERVQDHKVIDMWLLTLVYMNCESLQKTVQTLLKKKIIEGSIEEVLFDHCVYGNKELAQDYLPIFLSISEFLLACKEKRPREFGNHMYRCLFEQLHDTFLRQEVLGALVTHVGSGSRHEANTALEVMVLLASKYPEELIRLSSHITGILDYLESFSTEGLHKVYEVFSRLALFVHPSTDQYGSSIKNELLMIIRKQVNNPDLAYKRMGLIGTLKVVFYLGDAKNNSSPSPSLKSNYEEALELLETSFESCKLLPLPLILFYEELATTVQNKMLHPAIAEWIGKHVGEFESKYLSDLSGGALPLKDSYCGLEGELWMNLDGDISPICVNILPLVSSSLLSVSSLQVLPAYFVLLSAIERLANQGSLGGVDALLGCPLHLPASNYFAYSTWQSLSGKQKQTVILSLYYAVNWIRELLNAFCSQVAEDFDSTSQATKDEITVKLLKRLRNLVFLESLLNESLKQYPQSLPHLYPCILSETSNQFDPIGDLQKKREFSQENRNFSQNSKRNSRKTSKASDNSTVDSKFRQPTIKEMLKKVASVTSQESMNEESSNSASKGSCEDAQKSAPECDVIPPIGIFEDKKMIEAQKHKFRPLQVQCFFILSFKKDRGSCCSDPVSKLPLHLYLIKDLNQKLEYLVSSSKRLSPQCMSTQLGSTEMNATEFLRKIRPLFPFLRGHLDCAFNGLKEGAEICLDHWKHHSVLCGNPNISNMIVSKSAVYYSVFIEILSCFGKMLNVSYVLKDNSALSELLEAFQPINIPDSFFQELEFIPVTGSINYFYCGAYCFLEGAFDTARTLSFKLASEALLVLDSVLISFQKFADISTNGRLGNDTGCNRKILQFLSNRLGASSHTLLFQKSDDPIDKNLKAKGYILQKILRIYLVYSHSTSDSLNELACSILPQVNSRRTEAEDDSCSLPTFCLATFGAWYRVMHEENLTVLNNLIQEVSRLEKPRAVAKEENVEELLNKLQQSVNVVVSLVHMCRTHGKVIVHGMAIKYGGKFIDAFLKVFGFLQAQFQMHNEPIIHMVRDLQKATRTMQSLCSEAKASKQTVITSKIPATKRSMERFLFHVKALLHTTGDCSFWMGNLRHKDLRGQVVSSQAYLDDDENESVNEDAGKPVSDDEQQMDTVAELSESNEP